MTTSFITRPRAALLALMTAAGSSACAHEATPSSVPQGVLYLSAAADTRLVDLSHTFDHHTLYWPTDTQGFQLTTLAQGHTEGGYYYSAFAYAGAEHGGTHLDAPIHFAAGHSTTDQISLSHLVGPAVVIDLQPSAAKDPDALLTAAELTAFETTHGPIAAGSIVLVKTGWSTRWPERKAYLGDDTPGDASALHFPGVGKDAAELLVRRRVAAVGIDTASIDHGPSKDFLTHRVLLEAEIPAFENLTSLERLPPRGAWVVALPMKIGGGSGAPLRAIAILPTDSARR
ncbi:MAG: cyclase family protein [Polyangiales bacterium]